MIAVFRGRPRGRFDGGVMFGDGRVGVQLIDGLPSLLIPVVVVVVGGLFRKTTDSFGFVVVLVVVVVPLELFDAQTKTLPLLLS